MRRLLLALAALAGTALPAFATPIDGRWFCNVQGDDLGGLEISGASYRFTDLADMAHDGTLSAAGDAGYRIEDGLLRELHRYSTLGRNADGSDQLVLLGDGAFATCKRARVQ